MELKRKVKVSKIPITTEEYGRFIGLVKELFGYNSADYIKFEKNKISSPYSYHDSQHGESEWDIARLDGGHLRLTLLYNEFYPRKIIHIEEEFDTFDELLEFLENME